MGKGSSLASWWSADSLRADTRWEAQPRLRTGLSDDRYKKLHSVLKVISEEFANSLLPQHSFLLILHMQCACVCVCMRMRARACACARVRHLKRCKTSTCCAVSWFFCTSNIESTGRQGRCMAVANKARSSMQPTKGYHG